MDDITLDRYKRNKDVYLSSLYKKLQSKQFSFSAVKGMVKKKKNGENRLISVSTVEDRIVHRAILSVVNEHLYDHINTGVSYCGVKKDYWKKSKGKELSIMKAMQKLVTHVEKGNHWVFETDIKGFFDNIPKHRMICRIFRVLPDNSLRPLIRQMIRFEIGNPEYVSLKNMPLPDSRSGISQGSSLSPIFGNLYLSRFDKAMKSRFGDRYIRYVDDFIVVCSSKTEADKAQIFATKYLKKEQLDLSPSKTHVVNLEDPSKNILFLGLRVSKDGIFPKKKIRQLREWLNSKVLKVKNMKRPKLDNKKLTIIQIINSKIDGFTNFYKYYHSKNTFEELNKVLQKRKLAQRNLFRGLKEFRSEENDEIISNEKWKAFFR